MRATERTPGFLEQRPLSGLLMAALAAALASAFIYWAGYRWGIAHGADVDTHAEAYAGVVAGVLGTAVALGGSMVAIYLAAFAIRLQRLQNERDDRQAQVELLSVLTEQSGSFLRPYGEVVSTVRRMIGILEINAHDTIWKRVEDPMQVDVSVVQAFRPVVARLATETRALSERLADLSRAANANPFANAIFRHAFRGSWQPLLVAGEQEALPLASLQSVSLVVETHAGRLEALAAAPDAEVWNALMVARMLANGSRDCSEPPRQVQDAFVLLFLMFGYLASHTQYDGETLKSGKALRPPLCELLYLLTEAYTPDAYREGLEQLFAGNAGLSRTFAMLGEFAPNPLDPTTTAALDRYADLRPCFVWPPMRAAD